MFIHSASSTSMSTSYEIGALDSPVILMTLFDDSSLSSLDLLLDDCSLVSIVCGLRASDVSPVFWSPVQLGQNL